MNPAELFRQDAGALGIGPGDFLFREGESGDKMYVLLEGTAEIMVGDLVVEAAGPGALLGEMALIDNSSRTASVVAKTPCRLASIRIRSGIALTNGPPTKPPTGFPSTSIRPAPSWR